MQTTITAPFSQMGSDDFPKYLFDWEYIKLGIEKLLDQLPSKQNRRYNVHLPSSHILVKMYSLIANISKHQAAEELN